jgi:hypothetical protein
MVNFSAQNALVQRMRFVFLLLCGSCILLSSCGSSTKSVELAKQNVEQFHSQLDSEQFASLYAASDEKLRQSTSESDFVKLLDAVHRKLGNVQQSNLRNTGVAWFSGQGAMVTLVYETKFAQGTGDERFVWHIKDNVATLYGYHINSNELITR